MNVVDASIIASVLVRDSHYPVSKRLLDSLENIIVPDLLPLEVANVIWKHTNLFNRISLDSGLQLLEILDELLFTFEVVPSKMLLSDAYKISVELGLPIYDSIYVFLALSRKARFYTLDKKLMDTLRVSRYSHIIANT